MADILNQIDAVLADVTSCQCGCGTPLSERGPSPWFLDENHQARWVSRQVKAKSGTGEGSEPVEVAAVLRYDPGTTTTYGDGTGGIYAVPIVPRTCGSFTLADMEAASAAVRARRDALQDEIERVEAEVSARFTAALPPGYTVTFDRTPLLPAPPVDAALEPETAPTFTQSEIDDLRRRERLSLECAAHRPRCSGCDGAAQVDWGPCLHDCHEESVPDDEEFDAELIVINDRLVTALNEQIPVARWWRRMLGGGAR